MYFISYFRYHVSLYEAPFYFLLSKSDITLKLSDILTLP